MLKNNPKSSPFRCDGCGEWIWILYRGDRAKAVFSARFPLGVSSRKKFVLHCVATPNCPRNRVNNTERRGD
jgi:hypothetical protein